MCLVVRTLKPNLEPGQVSVVSLCLDKLRSTMQRVPWPNTYWPLFLLSTCPPLIRFAYLRRALIWRSRQCCPAGDRRGCTNACYRVHLVNLDSRRLYAPDRSVAPLASHRITSMEALRGSHTQTHSARPNKRRHLAARERQRAVRA